VGLITESNVPYMTLGPFRQQEKVNKFSVATGIIIIPSARGLSRFGLPGKCNLNLSRHWYESSNSNPP
jgi:hypothetical protein